MIKFLLDNLFIRLWYRLGWDPFRLEHLLVHVGLAGHHLDQPHLELLWTRLRPKRPSREGVGLFLLDLGPALLIGAMQDMLAQAFHIMLTPADVGIVMGSYTLSLMICQTVFGKITDFVGGKRVLVGGFMLLVLGLLAYPLAHNTLGFVIARIINGVTYAMVAIALEVVKQEIVPHERLSQARYMSRSAFFNYVGSGLFGYLSLTWLQSNHQTLIWVVLIGSGVASLIMVFTSIALIVDVTMGQVRRGISAMGRASKGLIVPEALLLSLPGVGDGAAYIAFLTWFANYVGIQKVALILLWVPISIGVAGVLLRSLVVKMGYFLTLLGSNLLMIVSLFLIQFGKESLPLLVLVGLFISFSFAGNSLAIGVEINVRAKKKKKVRQMPPLAWCSMPEVLLDRVFQALSG